MHTDAWGWLRGSLPSLGVPPPQSIHVLTNPIAPEPCHLVGFMEVLLHRHD